MAAIRGKHTRSTELALRMALVRSKITGWRLHEADLPGKPDVFFPRQKVAVFVDGCFWHGCPKCGHLPKTNRAFWRAKILRNKQRDRLAKSRLMRMRITTLRLWEHELNCPGGPQDIIDLKVKVLLRGGTRV